MAFYKYYAGLTSQVPFCATPLRLDPYNKCQFSCGYCFSSTRQGFGRDGTLKIANPVSLHKRLDRVSKGIVSSALDELISKRVPFQLGGMSDPFMKLELKHRATFEYLKILKQFDYPTVISTKGDMIANDEYLELLSGSNTYVRFSTTVIKESNRSEIDRGCPPILSIRDAADKLRGIKVPVSFRFQPIVPGHEKYFTELLELALDCGVKHISAEYLKVPIDANRKFSPSLIKLLGGDPIKYYKDKGAIKRGREYTLPLNERADWLAKMAGAARKKGITFGFADNDLLIHSDGDACCGASNLYLREANIFDANVVSLAKHKIHGELMYFDDYLSKWIPEKAVSTYLNSKARLAKKNVDELEWLSYLKEMWKGELGIFRPDYFDGIIPTSEADHRGMPVFERRESEFERSLSSF